MKEKLNFLIVDTSNENLTNVILHSKGSTHSKFSNDERGHIKNLLPLIRDLLLENKLTISELDFVSIVEGPGSWTGLRIGFASVKVLCMVNNLKLIVLNNFDLFSRVNKNTSTEVAILINSSNSNYYYRYVLNGTSEYSDGIASEEVLINKYPNINKVYFKKPEDNVYVEESLNKFMNNLFVNVDEAEPYYISTGDIKSNFTKAKL